jgi:hypothetical protein
MSICPVGGIQESRFAKGESKTQSFFRDECPSEDT